MPYGNSGTASANPRLIAQSLKADKVASEVTPPDVKSKPLAKLASVRRVIIYLLVVEFICIVMLEAAFLRNSAKEVASRLLLPTLSAVQKPSEMAVQSLSQELADKVTEGLIATGYFQSVAIIDDFGDHLSLKTQRFSEKRPLNLITALLGIDTQYQLITPLMTRSQTPGQLIADVNLTNVISTQIEQASYRTVVICFLSSLFTILSTSLLVGRIERAAKTLVEWTQQDKQQPQAALPKPESLKFAEFQTLAEHTAAALKRQHQALEQIALSHQKHAETLEAVSQALNTVDIYASLFDEHQRLIFSNMRSLPDSMIKQALARYPTHSDGVSQALQQDGFKATRLHRQRSAYIANQEDFRIQASDENESWVLQASTLDTRWVLLSGTKITDVRAQERSQLQIEKLKALGRVSSGVAHEFNNMLCIMMMSTEEALEQINPDEDATISTLLHSSLNAGERATEIVRQLRQLSQTPDDKALIDLQKWSQSAHTFLDVITGNDVVLQINCAGGLFIWVDPALFDAAIVNLCKNATDAMQGQTQRRLTIDIAQAQAADIDHFKELDPKKRYVSLVVTDTGPGIPKALREHVFDPFYSTKLQGQNVGLGLSTVYGFASNAGGGARLDSNYRQGARFCLLIECAAEVSPSQRIGATAKSDHTPLDQRLVLIVEDEAELADSYARSLRRAGAQVVVCHSMAEAKVQLPQQTVEAAVLDYTLPDGRGTDLAAMIKAQNPQAFCLCISGNVAFSNERQMTIGGVDQYASKPISQRALLNMLQQGIEQAQAAQPLA